MSRLALRLIAVIGCALLSSGCGSNASPPVPVAAPKVSVSVPPPGGNAEPSEPGLLDLLAQAGNAQEKIASEEDPEVLAYIKEKGWTQYRDIRIQDRKPLFYLTVSSPGPDGLTDKDYEMLARAKVVDVLHLEAEITDEGLKKLAAAAKLQAIILDGKKLTDEGVAALAGMTTLDNIHFSFASKVIDEGIAKLAALPRLKTLTLFAPGCSGTGLGAFAEAGTLETLIIDYGGRITDEGAAQIARIKSLKELKLKTDNFGEQKLTRAGIQAIVDEHLPAKFEFSLQVLDDELLRDLVAKGWFPTDASQHATSAAEVRSIVMEGENVTDAGFEVLLPCTNTTYLSLEKTKVTDETLKKLAAFRNLQSLSLEETDLTGAGLDALVGLPLEHVRIQNSELTEQTFQALGKMTRLKELWIPESRCEPAWFQHLSGLSNLEELYVRKTPFDDVAAGHVAKLPRLDEVTAQDTALGDAGFQELLKSASLRRIAVDGTKVSRAVYLKAKKDNPRKSLSHYQHERDP